MVVSAITAVLLAAGPACVAAATARAREHYARADYQGAIAALSDLEVCPDGEATELAEAVRWRAQAKAAAGDPAGAIDAFALLWTVLPTYVLDPLESPKFHELYASGRSLAARRQQVFGRLVRALPARAVAQVFDPHGRVKRVAVLFDFLETPASKQSDGTWQANVPEGSTGATLVLETGDAVIFRSLKVTLAELPAPEPLGPLAAVAPAQPADRTRAVALTVGGVALALVVAGVVTGVALSARRVDGSLGRLELP